jgi:hypothetical protein
MRLTVLISIFLIICALLCSFIVKVNANETWVVHRISYASPGSSLVLDSSDVPHIAFTENENGNVREPMYVMYASLNGTKWTAENTNIPGELYDFKLDASGNPHMLVKIWQLPQPPALYGEPIGLAYATKENSKWNIQQLDPKWLTGVLALDSAGNPHVAYIENGTQTLNFASLTVTGSGWNSQPIDSNITGSVSLVIDSNDNPQIMYQSNLAIKYAYWSQSNWTIETVANDSVLDQLVIDSHGYPCFLCHEHVPESSATTTLTYEAWNGSTWKSQSVVSSNEVSGGYVTLDSNNYSHIDYFADSSDSARLIYTRWTGYAWENETVDSNAASSGQIALDSNGNPHISYSGSTGSLYADNVYLMYATKSNQPNFTPIDSFLLIAVAVILVAVVFTYFWKKTKTKK